jgi:tetratricopeptide (TPR) repeat protein
MIVGPSPYRVVVTAAKPDPVNAAVEANRLYEVGLSHLAAGDLQQAASSFRQALALKADLAGAHSHLGVALQALGRHDEALQHYETAFALHPDDVGVLNNFGNALLALDRPQEAIAHYEQALARAPQLAEIHVNLANALHAANRHEEALRRYHEALALNPAFARAHMNLGNCLKALNRHSEAIESYEKALAIEPSYVTAWMNLAKALQALDRCEEAVQAYRKVLALAPADATARLNLGVLYLSLGRLADGFEHYESRWAAGNGASVRPYPRPRWSGDRIRGVLLLWAEQGVGDQILHSSMVPEMTARADSIVLEVDPRLAPLLARSFAGVQVIGLANELYAGHVDVHAPLGSLARFLRPSLEAFPRREHGYLIADKGRVEKLRQRLAADRRAVIGLSWISRNPEFGEARSARLRDFEALLRLPRCRFVDLQYGDTSAERAVVERETGIRIERLEVDNSNDIDGLAALISACDLVVTVDNTTVHLAGALGKPTWVLVPHGPARIWYWFTEREADSPWYPRVHVQRQRPAQPWADLMAVVAAEVGQSIAAR